MRDTGMQDNKRWKRWTLVVLALAIFGLFVWLDARSGGPGALAQESPLPTETPTPTATKVKRAVNEIVEPLETDAIFGSTRIVGTALVDSYQRYDIHVSPAGMENWQWVNTSFAIVHDDTLALRTRPSIRTGSMTCARAPSATTARLPNSSCAGGDSQRPSADADACAERHADADLAAAHAYPGYLEPDSRRAGLLCSRITARLCAASCR